MRLIDADALKETIKNERFSGWGNCCVEIDNAPTVDAVPCTDVEELKMRLSGAEAAINGMREQINRMVIINSEKVSVVCCKDCKHSYHTLFGDSESDCRVVLACSEMDDREVDPDWYCADGEKR